MKRVRQGLWLMAIGISMLCATTFIHADERGCFCTYNRMSGTFSFEPFLKVADKEYAGDNGEEVWGFRPWNLEPADKDGKTHAVNIPDSQWIPLNTFKEVKAGTRTKSIRCPNRLWPTD